MTRFSPRSVKRWTLFNRRRQAGQPASLHLTSNEINTLIARDPSYDKIKGHLFIALKDNEATIQTSLPLSSVESVMLTDSYLNGSLTLVVGFNPDGQEPHRRSARC